MYTLGKTGRSTLMKNGTHNVSLNRDVGKSFLKEGRHKPEKENKGQRCGIRARNGSRGRVAQTDWGRK